jgi:hypothetical protein
MTGVYIPEGEYLTTPQVAALLGVKPVTVRNRIMYGKLIPDVRIGGMSLFKVETIIGEKKCQNQNS